MSRVQSVPPPSAPSRRHFLDGCLSVAAAGLAAGPASMALATATPSSAIRDTYLAFVTAQNAGNLEAVRALLTETPRFLWVSDGMSIWGRDEAIARMGVFRASEVWRVTPDLDGAVVVPVDERTAYLHLSLDLEIGSRTRADRLPFLVSMLAHQASPGAPWRIAALFTTTRKTA